MPHEKGKIGLFVCILLFDFEFLKSLIPHEKRKMGNYKTENGKVREICLIVFNQ
jgi:hypothetical protein